MITVSTVEELKEALKTGEDICMKPGEYVFEEIFNVDDQRISGEGD